METKMMPFYKVQMKLDLSDSQIKRIIKTAGKRHREDMWVLYRYDATMVKRAYLYLEGVEWVKDVYLRNDIYYLDAEIDFAKKQIARLEAELQKQKDYFVFCEMSVEQLCHFFDKKDRSIRNAIKEVADVYPSEKIKRDGKVYITATGVRWLEEHIYRQKYWKDLLNYKRYLQSVKLEEETWQDQNLMKIKNEQK